MDRLKSRAKAGNSVAKKAQAMALRQRAMGDKNIAVEDRVYLLLTCPKLNPMDPPSLCVFWPHHMTIGEMLNTLANTYPVQCFGCAVRPDYLSLQVKGGEEIDLNSTLGEAFDVAALALDEVDLEVLPTKELVKRITAREKIRAKALAEEQAALAAEVATHAAAAAAATATAARDPVVPADVKVGDLLLYEKAGETCKVRVMEIHKDDWPNLYFTIKFNGQDREKQTTPMYLFHCPSSGASVGTSTADVPDNTALSFLIQVQCGKDVHLIRVHPALSIHILKDQILRARVPTASAASKLIHKGKQLKNTETCAALKAGAKLMLL